MRQQNKTALMMRLNFPDLAIVKIVLAIILAISYKTKQGLVIKNKSNKKFAKNSYSKILQTKNNWRMVTLESLIELSRVLKVPAYNTWSILSSY